MKQGSSSSPSPGTRREGARRGSTHARVPARRTGQRGRGAAVAGRPARAIAALDRWQAQYAETPADPLDHLAAYSDWIRAEIKLIRKLWGKENPEFVAQMADTMHRWALQIDQQIRASLEA